MAEHEGEALLGAEVGQPVPGEHAFDGDDEPIAIRRDSIDKGAGLGRILTVKKRLASLVEDAEIHCSGVQIDAAVESVLLSIETHHGLLAMGEGV